MSVEAITWALKQPIRQSSVKFVLVVLANCASGDTFLAYPSTAYLCDATGQDRKTVMANLAKLRECGLIEDTGKRAGATRQIVVYRVKCGPDLFAEQAQKRDSSEKGTVPKMARNSPVFPVEQAQKRDTEPSGTVKETKAKAGHARGTRLPAEWMPSAELRAFALSRLGSQARVDDEVDNFRDYWVAVPGARGVKLDWDATFRNSIRKARGSSHAPTGSNRSGQSAADRAADRARGIFAAAGVG